MAFTGLCILLCTADVYCTAIVSTLLRNCNSEVLYSGQALDTLTAICEAKRRVKIVLTNLHRIEAQVTSDIIHHIQRKLYLQTFFMSPNNENVRLGEGAGPFVAYIVHSFNSNYADFWRMSTIKSGEVVTAIARTSQLMTTWNPNDATTSTTSSTMPEESSGDALEKQARVVWTEILHRNFLKAIHSIPPNKKTPKELMQHMGDKRLNVKSIASHLQKYRNRMVIKKNKESKNYKRSNKTPTMEKMANPYMGFRLPNIGKQMEIEKPSMPPVEDHVPARKAPTPISPQVLLATTITQNEENVRPLSMPLVEDKAFEDEDIAFMVKTFWDTQPKLD